MTNKIHNLDESVSEYFEFVIKGHTYRFQHLNTEEVAELKKVSDDEEKTKEYMYKFILPVSKDAPSFEEISKKMISPQWARFREMITTEFSG